MANRFDAAHGRQGGRVVAWQLADRWRLGAVMTLQADGFGCPAVTVSELRAGQRYLVTFPGGAQLVCHHLHLTER